MMKLPAMRWAQALPTDLVLALARVSPCGNIPFAPGTWGSLAGVAFYAVGLRRLDAAAGVATVALVVGVMLVFAVIVCGEAEERLGKKDPGEVVLDEFAVMPLCFVGWWACSPLGWSDRALWLAGFILFRIFDIWKPLGIKKLQRIQGGWGVVIDDIAAALATCATLHLVVWFWPNFRL